jgi:hypothetical protein
MSQTGNKASGIIQLDALSSDDPFGFEPSDSPDNNDPSNTPPFLNLDDDDDPVLAPTGEGDSGDSSLNNGNDPDGNEPEGSDDGDGITNQNRGKQTPQPIIDPTASDRYRQQLKKLKITSVVQTVGDQDVETPIDDIDITEEVFTDLIQAYIAEETERSSKDKVSTKGLSDLTKKIIEIESHGGNPTSVLQYQQAYADPLDQLDLETTEGQRGAVALFMQANGKDQEDIAARLRLYEEQGVLAEKAVEFEAKMKQAIADHAEQQVQQAIEQERAYKENLKTYKKNFKDSLDSKFQLNDTVKSRLVDFATKPGEGNRFGFDVQLMEVRKNPELAAELALWLQDREEYIRQISNAAVTKTLTNTAQKIGTIRLKRKEDKVDPTPPQGNSRAAFFSLDD